MSNIPATATRKWDTAVELCHVTKYFDQKRPVSLFRRETKRIHALNDVSFTLHRGEFAAYAGPNGAGKSTTFKLLSGMLRPQQGDVHIFGMDPGDCRIPVMRRTGVLFGNRSELWWDHPVRASFEWKKAVWDVDEATYRRVVGEMRELLGLGEIWDSFVRELSLGQRMRANLALTLLHDPELVLLDEPTLGLDVLAKRQMIDFLKRINREKQTTLLVTSHDMDDLTEMADRILL
ncbi:MAG: ATP-binding cassette domain-containing protein, partial [Clostridia bacterium]|nr:ATP-binding cassette domain-containing protein [Clostridia bacterium]